MECSKASGAVICTVQHGGAHGRVVVQGYAQYSRVVQWYELLVVSGLFTLPENKKINGAPYYHAMHYAAMLPCTTLRHATMHHTTACYHTASYGAPSL